MSEPRKVEVDFELAHRFLHPCHTVLVTCTDKAGKANVITLGWSMSVSISPPMVAISVARERYSHQLIEETKEFVVNVPTMDIVKETLFCGRISGRTYDKFKETQLTPLPAKIVKPPIIKECVAHLECRLDQQITAGDHTLFIGSILTAYANEGVFDEKFDIKKVKPIYHMGGDDFITLASKIVSPQLQKLKAKNSC